MKYNNVSELNKNSKEYHKEFKSNEKLMNFYYFPIGLLMGIADSMPGFSGSTVTLLFKQYEIIMNRLSKILSKAFLEETIYSLQTLNFNTLFEKYSLFSLIYLFLGVGIGIIISFFSIATFIETYPNLSSIIILVITVLITFYYIYSNIKDFKKILSNHISHLFILIPLSIFSTLFIVLQSITFFSQSPLLFFVSAFIAIITMLLPGISGSLILVLFGTYTQLKTAIIDINFVLLIPFILGILSGAIISIKYISYLTSKYPIYSKYVILSLLLSAILSLSFSIIS